MTFREAAAAYRAKIDADKNANRSSVWVAMIERWEAGYYIDAETASLWRQRPVADVYALTLAA